MTNKLRDLAALRKTSSERIEVIEIDQICDPSSSVWNEILGLYSDECPRDKVTIVGSAISIETPEGRALAISAQELPRCAAVKPYVEGIVEYEEKIDELAKKLGFASRAAGGAKDIFKLLPCENWQTKLDSTTVANIKEVVETQLSLNTEEQARFLKFLASKSWSGVSKTLERTDWVPTAILGVGGFLNNASARRGELSMALAKSVAFQDWQAMSSSSDDAFTGGENVIYYGAPGTGKSYTINQKIAEQGKAPYRTVFHPDLQNSDFFGSLKPQMVGTDVTYRFSPGPFMKALVAAYTNPSEPVYLVVEELNRAAATAVFGDLFLLLDRDRDGKSEYDVSFPSPESEAWFAEKTNTSGASLRLPSNLFIYATMNSADQGVFPIDMAFRRRWQQVYLPLDYKNGPSGDVSYVDRTGRSHSIAWLDFIRILNDELTGCPALKVAEDRLVGQWFVKSEELDRKAIPEKLLLYLWDDLLRHEGREYVFHSGVSSVVQTYGDLVKEVSEARRVLSDRLLEKLNEWLNVEPAEATETDDYVS